MIRLKCLKCDSVIFYKPGTPRVRVSCLCGGQFIPHFPLQFFQLRMKDLIMENETMEPTNEEQAQTTRQHELHQTAGALQDKINTLARELRTLHDEIVLLKTPTPKTETVACPQCNGFGWMVTDQLENVAVHNGGLLEIRRCSCDVGQNFSLERLCKMLRTKFVGLVFDFRSIRRETTSTE